MNEVLTAIQERRSIRKFKQDTVSQDIIDKVIEAGLYAAIGMGQQSAIIVEITDKKLRDELSEMNRKIGGRKDEVDPFYGAPVVLVVFASKECPTCVYDGSIAIGI